MYWTKKANLQRVSNLSQQCKQVSHINMCVVKLYVIRVCISKACVKTVLELWELGQGKPLGDVLEALKEPIY